MEVNNDKIMATRCNVKVNQENIEAIVDSGASANIITQGLLEALQIEIQEPSNISFIIANGKRVAALGKTKIQIEMLGRKMGIEAQVMDARKRELILGNEFLIEKNGNIDYKTKTLTINDKEQKLKVPLTFMNNEEEQIEDDQEDEELGEEFEEEFEDEYEEVDKRELYTILENEEEVKTKVLA